MKCAPMKSTVKSDAIVMNLFESFVNTDIILDNMFSQIVGSSSCTCSGVMM